MAKIESKDIIQQDIYANAIKSAEDYLKVQDKLNESLKKEAKIQQEKAKSIPKTAKGVRDLEQLKKESLSTEAKQTTIIKENIKLRAKLNVLNSESVQKNEALKVQIQEQNKANKQLAREKLKLIGAYEKESKKLIKLRKNYKDLIISGKGAEKGTIALGKQITLLDNKLKSADAKAGQFQRQVGNYPKTFGKVGASFKRLSSIVGQFGIALGGVAIARDAFNTINDFGQSLANLSAITGASGADLDFYKKKAIEIGGATTLSASQTLEAFKLIGSANPELLKSSDALVQVTNDAIVLAEAAGIELPEAAKALTSTMNQFGASADEASKFVDVLAAGSKAGAGDINFLNTAFDKAGTVAKSAGLDFVETASGLEVLAKSGADASTSGTNFRNILINLQKAGKGFQSGQFELVDALEEVNAELNAIEDPVKRANTEFELFGKQNLASGQFLRNNIPLYKELNTELDKTGVAAEQQAKNNNTLQGSIKLLKSAWEEYILNTDEAGGVSEKLQAIIKFLAENLEVILDTIIRLGRAFVVFKTVLFLTNKALIPMGKGLLKVGKGMVGMARGTKSATVSMKAFGTAIKTNIVGIVAAAVVLIIELVDALDLFTSEADKAADRLEKRFAKIDALRKDASDETEKGLKTGNDLFRENNELLDLAYEKNKKLAKTQKERNELDAKYQKDRQKSFAEEDNRRRGEVQHFIKVKKSNDAQIEDNQNVINQSLKIIETGQLTEKQTDIRFKAIEKLQNKNEELEDFNIKVNKTIELRRQNLNEFGREQLKQAVSDIATRELKGKSNAKELTALEKLQKELKKLEKQRENLVSREGDINDPKTWEKTNENITITEKKIRNILIILGRLNAKEAESVDEFLARVDEKYNEAEEKRKDAAARRFDNLVQENEDELKFIELKLLKEGKTKEQISKIILEEEVRLLKERILIYKENGEEIIDLELDLARKQKAIEDKKRQDQIDSYKELIDNITGLLDTLTSIITKQIDKQIAKFTEQVDASKERQSELKELALNGNEDAKKSLQQEEKNEAEALSKKAQAEKRKAQLEKTSIILESIGNLVSQGLSIPEATAQSITAFQLVETALKGLDSFLVGTEDTGKNGSLDSNGGRLAILHDNERVLTKKQNKVVGNMTNWELATMAGQYQAGELNSPKLDIAQAQLTVFDTSSLESKIDNLTKTVASKPVQNWRVEQVTDDIKEYVETIHINGKATNNRFRKWRK